MKLQKADKVLFIGDSITDSGKREDPSGLGHGYVRMIHDYYAVLFPEYALNIVNTGISGNRVTDLAARWQDDVIRHEPNWVSISIGINDVWRQLDSPNMEQVYVDRYESVYRNLLDEVKKIEAKLILMQPTIIGEDVQSEGNSLLKPYVEVVNRLAHEYKAILIPTHEEFIQYLNLHTGKKLTTDGVHMNSLGNTLMAQTWIHMME